MKEKKNRQEAPKRSGAHSRPGDAGSAARAGKRDRSRKARIAVIIIAAFLALIAGGACAFGLYVAQTDVIFPNVTADGILLGGLTEEEAEAKLKDLGWDKKSDESRVTVLLPLEKTITVEAKDAGGFITAADAAAAAFDYGHDQSFLTAGLAYLRASVGGARAELTPTVDKSAVASIVDREVTVIKSELLGSGYDIDGDELLVVKGAKSVELDVDAICGLIADALTARDYSDISYDMDVQGGEEMSIDELYDAIFSEPSDAYYDAETKQVVDSVTGYEFNKTKAQRLWDGADYGETVAFP